MNEKKMRTKDLIYAGAFGAIYIVLMLIIVLACSTAPILYLIAPILVGLVCGTVYELCVLKVKRFGAALILGILFAVVASSGNTIGLIGAIVVALLAELVIKAGKYKSRKMYLASFVVFNMNMAMPYTMLAFAKDAFIVRAREFYGDAYADGLAAVTPDWIWFAILAFAIIGGILGALVANKLIKKHFEKAEIV